MSDELPPTTPTQARRPHTILHEGEIEAQTRFGGRAQWSDNNLRAMFENDIPDHFARFAESLPFFFIATANARGECDCSFRGREFNTSGQPFPLVKVFDPRTLVFPDYRGNNLFNSLGNILVNPNVGMLFIDFQARARMRVNGRAEIIEDRSAYGDVWPYADRYVKVTPVQVFPNCRARIPGMTLTHPYDIDLHDG